MVAVSARDQISNGTASASVVMRRLGRRLSGRQAMLVGVAPGLVEIGLVIAIGFILLSAVFSFLAPLPVPKVLPAQIGAAAPTSAPVVLEQTPFRIAAIEAVAPEITEVTNDYEETNLNLKLHGVYTLGDTPSAFIQTPDGNQKTVRIGEEIWNNAELASVHSDYIVIVTGGVRETLTLENRDPSERQVQARRSQQPASASRPELRNDSKVENYSGSIKPAPSFGIGNIAQLDVRPGNGKLGLFVMPGLNEEAFEASGLKAGDQIIAVNNRRIGDIATEAESLLASIAGAKNVSLLVERDGVSVPIQLELSPDRGIR